MQVIWKYPIKVTGRQTVSMPRGAMFLAVQSQGDIPCLWALVDPAAPVELLPI